MPGNGGISELAKCINIDPLKKNEVYEFCKKTKINLVVIGPELYLEDGLSDYLLNKQICVFGPSKKASKLETSKVFSKKFLKKNKIPTGKFKTFKSFNEIKSYINISSGPFVIKADGLASGKGVLISNSKDEAIKNSYEILINDKFGAAGKQILLEEYLEGFEISYFIFLDKNTYHIIDYALDHKKLKDGESEKQIYDYLKEKYGVWILYDPEFDKNTYFLWLLPLLMFLIGGVIIFKVFIIKKN